ncbi:hypothetical protein C3Y91_28460 [Rhizobium sp. UPM1133]|nr:hypothetical protein [Rhizobium ruizarguesonis]
MIFKWNGIPRRHIYGDRQQGLETPQISQGILADVLLTDQCQMTFEKIVYSAQQLHLTSPQSEMTTAMMRWPAE